MGIQKRQAKGGRYIALACMFGMMICLFLYVSVLMPRFMTIIMLFLASSLLGCLVVEGEFGKAFWVYVATSVFGLFMVGGIYGMMPYFLFCGWYPILKFALEESRDKIIVFAIKMMLFNLLMALAVFLAPQPVFTPYATNLPAWLMALIFNAFFLLYDGWSSLVALVYANHIRQYLL